MSYDFRLINYYYCHTHYENTVLNIYFKTIHFNLTLIDRSREWYLQNRQQRMKYSKQNKKFLKLKYKYKYHADVCIYLLYIFFFLCLVNVHISIQTDVRSNGINDEWQKNLLVLQQCVVCFLFYFRACLYFFE